MKNRLRGLNETVRAIVEDALQDSYNEGYKHGKASAASSIVEGESIMHEGLFLTKVNREAREGDYIRPTAESTSAAITKGTIYGPVNKSNRVSDKDGYCWPVYTTAYNRITLTVEVFEVVSDSPPQIIKSANQQRAELIEKAKQFVEEKVNEGECLIENDYYTKVNISFFRKGNKTTCVITPNNKYLERFVGRSYCNSDEVFNQHIGERIALAKALEIDIPIEFLQAVQPTKLVTGHIIEVKYHEKSVKQISTIVTHLYEVKSSSNTAEYIEKETYWHKIIDDTNAQYEAHQ